MKQLNYREVWDYIIRPLVVIGWLLEQRQFNDEYLAELAEREHEQADGAEQGEGRV